MLYKINIYKKSNLILDFIFNLKVHTNFNTMRTPRYIKKYMRTAGFVRVKMRTPKMACVHNVLKLQ